MCKGRIKDKIEKAGLYYYMEEICKIIYKGGSGEITEKKSRFIATLTPVHTEEQAQEFIERIRKKYWDARHNCYAYVIGDQGQISRCSDDGEPSQTAGKPMLDVLLGAGIHDAAVVVTRYFGGTLLGTGGLVRAYSAAVSEGLSHCQIGEKRPCARLRIVSDYTALGKIRYIGTNMDLVSLDCSYGSQVAETWLVLQDEKERFIKKVTQATSGQAKIEDQGMTFAVFVDNALVDVWQDRSK